MSQEKPGRRDFITKEIFIMMTPILASYLWTIFYEAGSSQYYGIPFDFIDMDLIDILLTNRLTLIAATLAFLWIGLYYNLMPSVTSAIFKGIITLFLIVAISLGFLVGHLDATSRTEYLVTNIKPESIVLRIYGDTLITAPFDRDTKTVFKSFNIHGIGANPNLRLSLQEVGPLIPIALEQALPLRNKDQTKE